MSKILSLIIPTYNMAALLPRCLDSLLSAGVNEYIEAIVVNDGSRDDSLAVAKKYADENPDCIVVIDKPNGNYGSTINAALPLAAGKFIKVLDSDDWFDSNALGTFVRELAGVDDVDMVITHFNILNGGGSIELSKYNVYGREPYEYGKVYDLDYVLEGGYIRFFLMHSITYRTGLLLSSGYRQSEGMSYTDTQWCTYPLFYAKSIVFFDVALYQYNLDREGQTMDPKVMLKSLDQMSVMTFDMLEYYNNFNLASLSAARRAFINQYYRNRVRILAKCYLYDIPCKDFNPEEFEPVDNKLREFIVSNGLEPIKLWPENKVIRIDVYKYWQKHHRRLPACVEKINNLADALAHRVYRMLFR